jgi:hypothetical protein
LSFSIGLIFLYATALFFTFSLPVAIDPVEVSVAELSYLSVHLQPIYTALSAPERYSLLYGPLCYLPYGLALRTFGSTITSLKLAVILCNLVLIVALWLLFRRLLSRRATVITVGLVLSALMMKQMAIFLIRGDTALALAVAGALLAISIRRTTLSVLGFSLACGLAVDIKFTAVFYLLVPIYFLWKRHGRIAASWVLPCSTVLAALPFAMSNISLRNYFMWLHEAAHHPLSVKLLMVNIAFIGILSVPAILLSFQLWRDLPNGIVSYLSQHRVLFLLLLISASGSALAGSKVGAGRSHLNPTIIVFAFVTVLLWNERSKRESLNKIQRYSLMLYAVVFCIPALIQVRDLWSICMARRQYALSVSADLSTIQTRFRHQSIELGYGISASKAEPVEASTNSRTQLVLSGNPVTVDAAALFDMGLSGVPMPSSTVAAVSSCQIRIWLIPVGEDPFEITNGYAMNVPKLFPDDHLFSVAFRNAFLGHYKKIDRSRYFDIWECDMPQLRSLGHSSAARSRSSNG